MDHLKAALGFGGILSTQEINYVAGFFEERKFKLGQEFLTIGNISNRIGFVDEGVFRVYAVGSNREEATKDFIRKNQFVMDIESFYNNQPCRVTIQAVTDSRMFSIHRSTWYKLSEELVKLFILTKSLTESALLNKMNDNEFLHFGSAKDKYIEFMKRYPDLTLHVPLQYIASYLNITPQSLSRIRKEM